MKIAIKVGAQVVAAERGPTLIPGYRSVFRFTPESGESPRTVAERFLRDWLRSRHGGMDKKALEGWDGKARVNLPSGAVVDVFEFSELRNGTDAIRYRLTEDSEAETYEVSVSAATVGRKNSDIGFLIEVAKTTGEEPDQGTAIKDIGPPRITREILEQRRVFDGQTRLQGSPRVIHAWSIDELVDSIADQDRAVDLLVAASLTPESDERWSKVVKELTAGTVGAAAAYFETFGALEELNGRLPEPLRIEGGHLRIIAPKVNYDNPDATRHPLLSPDYLRAGLDSDGMPTSEVVGEVAFDPRKQLLSSPLPAYLRRTMELLDQQERKEKLSAQVDERVEERLADEGLEELGSSPYAPTVETTSIRESDSAFPSRRELHAASRLGEVPQRDFWALIARWLEESPDSVNESSAEDHLEKLDKRILRDREELRVHQDALDESEAERGGLEVELAELQVDIDALENQLRATEKRLAAAEKRLEQQAELTNDRSVDAGHQEGDQGFSDAQMYTLQLRLEQAILGQDGEGLDVRREVDDLLSLTAERLDPIIQNKLEFVLRGRPWTVVLEELDYAKGRASGLYTRTDPAAQLRVLTERLGELGYPFDESRSRVVSTFGQELRSLRHRHAHHGEIEESEVVRGYDTLRRLVRSLGDDEGFAKADEKYKALARQTGEHGVSLEHIVEAMNSVPVERSEEQDSAFPGLIAEDSLDVFGETGSSEGESVQPSPEVFEQAESVPSSILGGKRPEYEPWQTIGNRNREVLDNLSRRIDQQRLQAVIEEITEFEGPIHLDRLITLVGREFGNQRLVRRRKRAIEGQVRKTDVVVDEDRFAWPPELERETWAEFRPNDSTVDREFTHISPIEIRNAARFIRRRSRNLEGENLEREVLRTFGRSRRTSTVLEHLKRGMDRV